MRIAVSGTHCSGKSTLIAEFLRAHPDFAYEPEPYTVLVEDYGEEFSAAPRADDFYRQLEFNIDRLRSYTDGERVICERSPVDFLAYLLALRDLERDGADSSVIKTALPLVVDALQLVDLIVFLPLDETNEFDLPDEEDPKLRMAADVRLAALLIDDELGVVQTGGVAVVEARGSTAARLRTVEGWMEKAASSD